MRRVVAGAMTWWLRLFLLSIVLLALVEAPRALELAIPAVPFVLMWVRPRRPPEQEPRSVAPPIRGRWTALNSPATKVPSHGVRAYGQAFAIDVLRARPPDAPAKIGWGVGMRRAESYPSFGSPVLAVADGTVVRASGRQRDHRSRASWPALAFMLIVEGAVRELGGAPFVLGNHLVVDHGDGVYAAYAHLRRGSLLVGVGDRVEAGQHLADVGSSGNTTEPHLHVQLMDRPSPTAAAGIPFRWTDLEIIPGEVDRTYQRRPVDQAIEPGLPANGQVFTAG